MVLVQVEGSKWHLHVVQAFLLSGATPLRVRGFGGGFQLGKCFVESIPLNATRNGIPRYDFQRHCLKVMLSGGDK